MASKTIHIYHQSKSYANEPSEIPRREPCSPNDILDQLVSASAGNKPIHEHCRRSQDTSRTRKATPQTLTSVIALLNRHRSTAEHAERVLQGEEKFYHMLPGLDKETWKAWFELLWRRSVGEHITCCVWKDCLYLDLPECWLRFPLEEDDIKEKLPYVAKALEELWPKEEDELMSD
ncbi:hypothetical protein BO78DRAFT_397428 [Aspergillus sclerotiicarbonarius CBS 121057]|uniref:Uncharacterized protein n=1 Tax=Aspergillus sclerotiicarbonarius (strain CBS 121057 / IBT 28362) TaxID=1448318 RepID=A0A319E8S3_ASPSB|nr:hypothetical protein BO78DRAFT_397428 [Aspergillus sclerotiicarbonarius CBS 121057]